MCALISDHFGSLIQELSDGSVPLHQQRHGVAQRPLPYHDQRFCKCPGIPLARSVIKPLGGVGIAGQTGSGVIHLCKTFSPEEIFIYLNWTSREIFPSSGH